MTEKNGVAKPSVMAKNKKAQNEQSKPEEVARSPVITIRLGHEREAALAKFIAAQLVPPEKTATILKALDRFLEQEGFAPTPKAD